MSLPSGVPSSSTLNERFMAAFNDIEQHIKRSLYGNTEVPGRFAALLKEYGEKRRRYLRAGQQESLTTFAELRNTLVHNPYFDGKPIAEPSEAVTEAIERLRDEMLNPLTALTALKGKVPTTIASDMTVGDALSIMYDNDYSQLPVYDGKTYRGLLTTNTVARWVADQMRQHEGKVEDAFVSEVLEFTEGFEHVLHMPRTLTVAETVWRFASAAQGGRPITALIITNSGNANESPLGIVVAENLSRLS